MAKPSHLCGGLLALALGCAGAPGQELLLPEARPRAAEAIVVLGNRPPTDGEGRVRPELARRIARGVELFEQGLAPLIVFAGGPDGRGVVEADVMAREAERRGVPPTAMLRERASRDTAENARLSMTLLCEGRARCRPRILLVSSPYHLRRAERLFRCAGADVQAIGADLPDTYGWQVGFAAYEYGVRLAAPFDDACDRARRASAE